MKVVATGRGAGAAIGCGLLGLAAGACGVIAVAFGVLSQFGDRVPPAVAHDRIELISYDTTDRAFYVHVGFADDSSLWMESTDGGATWTKTSLPGRLGTRSGGSVELTCARDDVCYLAHQRSDGQTVIDRLAPDRTWKTEATYADECRVNAMVVDSGDSDQAMVSCGTTTLAYRDDRGHWRILDVVEVARTLR